MKAAYLPQSISKKPVQETLPRFVFRSDFNHAKQINESRFFVNQVLTRKMSKWHGLGDIK